MEKKIDIWEEFNQEEDTEMPAYILEDIKLIFSQYDHKMYELKDGWLFKLQNPYFLTELDEKSVIKHCQKRDKFNFILMKELNGKTGLQRPGIQEVAHSGLQARRL